MSQGAVSAGVKVALAVESDRNAAATYAQNHRETCLYAGDIRGFTDRKIKAIRHGTKATVVFGGPPCQGFSYSNSRTRTAGNPENWLFTEFLRVVRAWQPDIVVFENVQGIVNTANGTFLRHVLRGLEELKYNAIHGVLNAADFGVAQNRARLFLLASRHRCHTLHLPEPQILNPPTVAEAIGDLPPLANGAHENRLPYKCEATSSYARRLRGGMRECANHLVTKSSPVVIQRYRAVPQGGNWTDIPALMMKNYVDRSRCHTGIYHRLHSEQPSVVIGNYRKNMLIHPVQHRGLSVREAARIQSFPDCYEFSGSVGFQQQQVGNAVPPLLARAVFRHVCNLS